MLGDTLVTATGTCSIGAMAVIPGLRACLVVAALSCFVFSNGDFRVFQCIGSKYIYRAAEAKSKPHQ